MVQLHRAHFSSTHWMVGFKGTGLGVGVGAWKLEGEARLMAGDEATTGVEDEATVGVEDEVMVGVEDGTVVGAEVDVRRIGLLSLHSTGVPSFQSIGLPGLQPEGTYFGNAFSTSLSKTKPSVAGKKGASPEAILPMWSINNSGSFSVKLSWKIWISISKTAL